MKKKTTIHPKKTTRIQTVLNTEEHSNELDGQVWQLAVDQRHKI